MEFIIAVIIFVALLTAWFILPSSKTVHSNAEKESVTLTSAPQV
ncbi:MAG: hypothetical protein SH847_18465 [Roseiflexaceae bacterium]|nr:hypothetical protein [Roseiflexaceae bacterium]